MSSTCGRTNRNERGSSYDRRRRKAWLVSPEAGFGGDGHRVPCWECGKSVATADVIADRRIPGSEGGTYRRSNIQGPHCQVCSCRQGVRMTNLLRATTDPYDDTDHCRTCGAHYLGQHAADCDVPLEVW